MSEYNIPTAMDELHVIFTKKQKERLNKYFSDIHDSTYTVASYRGEYNSLFQLLINWIRGSSFLGYELITEDKDIVRVRNLR